MTYANDAKKKWLGVSETTLETHGAVSEETARAMADGARAVSGVDYAISVTGIAGPTGGSEEKPVGLVYHALADGKKTEVIKRDFPGDRDRIRWYASQQALDMVRRKLM